MWINISALSLYPTFFSFSTESTKSFNRYDNYSLLSFRVNDYKRFFCIKINSNLNKHLNCESGNKIFFNALCAIWWIKHLIDVLSSKVRKIELKAWIKFMAVSLFEILLRVLLSWWSRSLHEKQIWKSKWQTKRNLIGINCDSEIKRDIERNNCGRKVSRFADVFLLPCYKGGLNSRVRDFEDGLSGALTRRFSRWRENVSPIIS